MWNPSHVLSSFWVSLLHSFISNFHFHTIFQIFFFSFKFLFHLFFSIKHKLLALCWCESQTTGVWNHETQLAASGNMGTAKTCLTPAIHGVNVIPTLHKTRGANKVWLLQLFGSTKDRLQCKSDKCCQIDQYCQPRFISGHFPHSWSIPQSTSTWHLPGQPTFV